LDGIFCILAADRRREQPPPEIRNDFKAVFDRRQESH
jgi:hypothetical protein